MLKHYIPLQPEFEREKEYYVEFIEENSPYNQVVVLYYQYKCKKTRQQQTHLVIPDVTTDIEFYCHPFEPFARVCGSFLDPKEVFAFTEYEYFGVRLRTGQGILNPKCSPRESINSQLQLNDLLTTASLIIEQIAHKKSFYERIEHFRSILKSGLLKFNSPPPIINYLIDQIHLTLGNINLLEVSEKTAYSTRYLRKRFEEYTGISPKLFGQIVRFQNSLNMMLRRKYNNIVHIANDTGYYDQAHFTKEFKRFCLKTPSQFIKNNR